MFRIGILLKILSSIVLMGLVMAGIVHMMSQRMLELDGAYNDILTHESVAVTGNARSTIATVNAGKLLWELAVVKDAQSIAALDKQFADTDKLFADQTAKVAEALPQYADKVAGFKKEYAAIMAEKPKILAALASGNSAEVEKLGHEVDGMVTKLRGDMRSLTEEIEKIVAAKTEKQSADTVALIREEMILAAIGGGIALLIAFAMIQFGVIRPLKKLATVMVPLAKGDFSVQVPSLKRRDEVGDMARTVEQFKQNGIEAERAKAEAIRNERALVSDSIGSGLRKLAQKELTFRINADLPADYLKLRDDFNNAMAQLQETILSVSGSVLTITSGTQQISSASDDLARRTESQAASIEETAAAISEISGTVKRTAEGAVHARSVVATAEGDAAESREVVGKAIEAMKEIEGSSAKITQIIGVIDEIAFQTNLLALNAGVEAARAGEAGRGFAVVASEVRALAQRSADAAKEIKSLISAARNEVERGVSLVEETGQKLYGIVGRIGEINTIVKEIAGSAENQASSLQEINVAVDQMDQSTQQNAAMVEEANAATRNLADQSASLRALVSGFDVSSGGRARAA